MNQKRERNLAEYGFNFALLLLGLFSTWYIFFGLFEFPYTGRMVGFACLCGTVFAGIFLLRKFSARAAWILFGLVAVIWLIVGWNMRETLFIDTPQVFTRYIIPNLNRIVFYEFPEQPETTLLEQWNCAMFCMYLLLPYVWFLSYGLLVRNSRILTLLITIPVFAFTYALQGLPSTVMLALIFIFWIVITIKPKHHTGEIWLSHFTVAGSVVLSALFLIVLLALFTPQGFEPYSDIKTVRQGITDLAVRFENFALFQGNFGMSSGAPLTSSDGNVNLNSTGSIRFTDKDILMVYMGEPETIYLKGYSAAVYDGNQWSQLEAGQLSGTGIPEDTMQYLGRLSSLTDYMGWDEKRISVEHLTSSTNYTFTPYLLTTMDPNIGCINDSYYPGSDLQSSTFMSRGSGNLGSAGYQISRIYEVLNGNQNFFYYVEDADYLRAGLTASSPDDISYTPYTEEFEILFQDVDVFYSYRMENGGGSTHYDVIYGDRLYYKDRSDLYFTDYYGEDSQYIRGIKSLYTQLPDGMDEQLLTWWLEQMGYTQEDEFFDSHMQALKDTPYWQWPVAAYEVAKVVQGSGDYSRSPGRQPVNRDFVEYFLYERSKGYCVHYASATVTLLRAMGIPARYVEGYVVDASLFDSDNVAYVPAENAHAWAEFWMPGTGWVPLESTPGGASTVVYGEEATTVAASTEIEADREHDVYEFEAESDELGPEDDLEVDPRQEAETELESADASSSGIYWPIVIIVGLILLFLGLRWGRNLWHWNWRRRFSSSDTNRAALYLYDYMEKLCRYGCKMPEASTRIAMKAQYSKHAIEKDELAQMQDDLETCKKDLERTQSWGKVFLLRILGFIEWQPTSI